MEFEYPFEAWIEDWAACLEATGMIPKESAEEYFGNIFRSHYTNPQEAVWKGNRIAAAVLYINRNHESLEQSGWLLRSSKTSEIGPHLTVALYRVFSIASDAVLLNPPAPEVVIAAAEEQWRLNP